MSRRIKPTDRYMSFAKKCSAFKLGMIATSFLVGPGTSFAAGVFEEIVVTAQKREQNLQDVGIAVTAFSGAQLSELGLVDTINIVEQTPNVQMIHEGPTVASVNIRGVGQTSFAEHHEPPVAAYVDEAYVSTMVGFFSQMYDMERVEVLRGPQGTLFGRNATGGLVHFVSRKPEQELSAYAEMTLAEYNQVTFQGAVGGGITDSIAARLSIATNRHDGYMENLIGDDLSDANNYSARLQFLFDISEDTSLLVKGHYGVDNTNGSGVDTQANGVRPDGFGVDIGQNELGTFNNFLGGTFQTCVGCNAHGYKYPDDDPRKNSYDFIGYFDREISGLTAKVEHDISDELTLTTITDYFTLDKRYSSEIDGSPLAVHRYHSDQFLDQFSQEIRLNGETENLSWTAGVYGLSIENKINAGINFNVGPFIGLPVAFDVRSITGFEADLDTKSWAIFAQGEYALANDWSLITGLRYTDDKKEVDYNIQNNLGLDQHFNPSISSLATQNFENASAKLQLNWMPNDDTLIYAGLNRGHKAGSFNLPFVGPVTFADMPHDEEVLTSFELGYKGTFADGAARLNASLYYYDYKDHQASFFVNFAQNIGNLDATAVGGEIELVLNPIENLEILLGVSVQDTTAEDVGLPDGTFRDRELALTPAYTFNGLVSYTWPMPVGSLTAQVDFNVVDDYCWSAVCHPNEEEDSNETANARITFKSLDEKWSIAAFVRNATDSTHRTFANDSNFIGFRADTVVPPRWYGVTATYNM